MLYLKAFSLVVIPIIFYLDKRVSFYREISDRLIIFHMSSVPFKELLATLYTLMN